MTRSIRVGLSLYPTDEVRDAAMPLVEAGVIDAIEWTVDLGFGGPVDDWVATLLDSFAAKGALFGHGLFLSPTSARFDAASTAWLSELAQDRRRYQHVTDHWGFSRARGLTRGAPLPLVAAEAVVATTTHALRALGDVARAPVGLENLALALSPDELATQPAMLARTLDAIDGVLLLDLHNVWCQAVNFEHAVRELVCRYPLDRVRQLHVAGGGWSDSSYGPPVRRDTHDGWVPDEVLDLLAWVIPRCPALEVVILERVPPAFEDPEIHARWRDEWRTVADVVRSAAREPLIAVPRARQPELDREHTADDVAGFQDALVRVLLDHRKGSAADAHRVLLADPGIAPFRHEVERWQLRGLEVAIALVDKWSVVA